MKKTAQQEVTCPHCRGTQLEPAAGISTYCKHCGRHFKINPSAPRKRPAAAVKGVKAARETREVTCLKCGTLNTVAVTAMSTQCIGCLQYLELGNKTVRGVQTGKLYAYDDVTFAENCSFKGIEATGRRLEIRGKVVSKLRATAEIAVLAGGQVSGELHAPVVAIERGAKARVMTVACDTLKLQGEFEVTGSIHVGEVVIHSGAQFSGLLHLPEGALRIEPGAQVAADTLTCAELTVAGRVTIAGRLTAGKVVVEPGGELEAGVIQAGHLDVAIGGSFQGLIGVEAPAASGERDIPIRAHAD